jgi:hypothetical protein
MESATKTGLEASKPRSLEASAEAPRPQLHYLHPSDPEEPTVRLHVERSCDTSGIINIWEAAMTSSGPSAQEIDVHDRLILLPAAARWLRDTLNRMNLEDNDGYTDDSEAAPRSDG